MQTERQFARKIYITAPLLVIPHEERRSCAKIWASIEKNPTAISIEKGSVLFFCVCVAGGGVGMGVAGERRRKNLLREVASSLMRRPHAA